MRHRHILLVITVALTAAVPPLSSQADIRRPLTPNPNLQGSADVICANSTKGQFDPIVYPTGSPASHYHVFFGNKGITSTSTDASLNPRDTFDATTTSCPQFEDPYYDLGGSGGYPHSSCANVCEDSAAYWQPAVYMCSSAVSSWTGYVSTENAQAKDPLSGCGGGTGFGHPCVSGTTNALCNSYTTPYPDPQNAAYYLTSGFATMGPPQPDGNGVRPNIIAGMGDGTLTPATTEGGLPIVRYHCGASSSYSSPTTTRPYDCNWALNDCQWKLNGGNQYQACTNLIHGLVVEVALPMCWDGSNTYATGTQNSNAGYSYGTNTGGNYVYGTQGTDSHDGSCPAGHSTAIASIQIRQHTKLFDPCLGDGVTPSVTSPDPNCAAPASQMTYTCNGTTLCTGITQDTTSNGIDAYMHMGWAGLDSSGASEVHGYWSAHADFMDSWGQGIIDDIVQACLNGGTRRARLRAGTCRVDDPYGAKSDLTG